MHKKVGVVGAGYWGPNLIRNCHDLGVLDAVCDTDGGVLQSVAARYPGLVTTTRYEDLLARDISAVIIATPAQTHASLCLRALSAGKHVFVEKPLALSVEEGELIANAAEKAGKIAFVGHLMLYHPALRKIRSMIEEGVIGRVWHVRFRRLSLGKLRNHEDVWWSFAPHDVAVMLAIFGEEPLSCVAARTAHLVPGMCDVAYADFFFSEHRSAHIEVCWLDPDKTARIDVFGSNGVLSLNDSRKGSQLTLCQYRVEVDGVGQRTIRKNEPQYVSVGDGEPLKEEILAFLEAIETGNEPETSAKRGVAILRAISMVSRTKPHVSEPMSALA